MSNSSQMAHFTELVVRYGCKPDPDFGPRIKDVRLAKGLQQADVARAIDLHQNHLCRIENGREQASLAVAFRLSQVLEVDIQEVAFPAPAPFPALKPFEPSPPASRPRLKPGSLMSRALEVIKSFGEPVHVKDIANALEVHYLRIAGDLYKKERIGLVVRTGKATWATPEIAQRLQAVE